MTPACLLLSPGLQTSVAGILTFSRFCHISLDQRFEGAMSSLSSKRAIIYLGEGDNLAPSHRGHLALSEDILIGRSVIAVTGIEARDASKQPTVYRTVPHNKHHLTPNVHPAVQ